MVEVNQCDGCRNGMPIVDGIHRNKNGTCFMMCTGDRYKSRHMRTENMIDGFRSIVILAAKMLERDETPARTEVAKDLQSASGAIIERLRAI